MVPPADTARHIRTLRRGCAQSLSANSYRVVFLDHELHCLHAADSSIVKGTGKEVALALAQSSFEGIVVIHSKNEAGPTVMAQHLPQAKLARFGDFEIVCSH